jgi:hypothetical protein
VARSPHQLESIIAVTHGKEKGCGNQKEERKIVLTVGSVRKPEIIDLFVEGEHLGFNGFFLGLGTSGFRG